MPTDKTDWTSPEGKAKLRKVVELTRRRKETTAELNSATAELNSFVDRLATTHPVEVISTLLDRVEALEADRAQVARWYMDDACNADPDSGLPRLAHCRAILDPKETNEP